MPRDTLSCIVEELIGGKHFIQMIYSRFVKYLSVIKNNKRLAIRTLYNISANNVKVLTGANIRKILLQKGMYPDFGIGESTHHLTHGHFP